MAPALSLGRRRPGPYQASPAAAAASARACTPPPAACFVIRREEVAALIFPFLSLLFTSFQCLSGTIFFAPRQGRADGCLHLSAAPAPQPGWDRGEEVRGSRPTSALLALRLPLLPLPAASLLSTFCFPLFVNSFPSDSFTSSRSKTLHFAHLHPHPDFGFPAQT